MTPVDQTVFGARGNCLSACVAMLLAVPLEDVPLFHGPEWWWTFVGYLRTRGVYPLRFEAHRPPGLFILSGLSPRGDYLHSVVARGEDMVHDPHPSRDGVRTMVDAIVLVPADPSTLPAELAEAQHWRRVAEENASRWLSRYYDLLYRLCAQQGGSAMLFDVDRDVAREVAAKSLEETRFEDLRATRFRLVDPPAGTASAPEVPGGD